MSSDKLKCDQSQVLMMGLLDNELSAEERSSLMAHIESCADCQQKYDSFKQLKKETGEMKLKKLPEMYWDDYWTQVYNRIERGVSWILISIGAMVLLVYGGYEIMHEFYMDPGKPLIIKIGAALLTLGMIVLSVSVLREKLMIRKVDKYRSVKR